MEAYESFTALAMETEGLVVSEAMRFPVRRQTGKVENAEFQTHGFEADSSAPDGQARSRTVKSFFGSAGVQAHDAPASATAAGTPS